MNRIRFVHTDEIQIKSGQPDQTKNTASLIRSESNKSKLDQILLHKSDQIHLHKSNHLMIHSSNFVPPIRSKSDKYGSHLFAIDPIKSNYKFRFFLRTEKLISGHRSGQTAPFLMPRSPDFSALVPGYWPQLLTR